MPDPHRIARELEEYLSLPEYANLFLKAETYKNPGPHKDGRHVQAANVEARDFTPKAVAEYAAKDIWRSQALLDPVEVKQLAGPVQLFRSHDGGATLTWKTRDGIKTPALTARTLGAYWTDRGVMEQIWKGTARYPPAERGKWFKEFLRSANFVLPEWSAMTRLVCLTVPAGRSIVVVTGRGNWKAMKTPAGTNRPGGALNIRSVADVMANGMMPMPGVVQCYLPLVDSMWVQPVFLETLAKSFPDR